MRKLGKLPDGRQLLGKDLDDVTVKAISDYELEIIGSTGALDRDNEILDPKGWDIKNFKKNPVVLPSHLYYEPAIARAKNVKIKDGQLSFRIEFPEEGVNPVADVYRKLYKSGFMNASSVGFVPVEWKNGTGDKEPSRTYTKQELLELSLVSVPANPEALVTAKGINQAIGKGVITNDDLKVLKDFIGKVVKNDDDEGEQGDLDTAGNEGKPNDAETPEKQEAEKQTNFINLKTAIEDNWVEFKELVNKAVQELKDEGLYKGMLFGEGSKNSAPHLDKHEVVDAVREALKG